MVQHDNLTTAHERFRAGCTCNRAGICIRCIGAAEIQCLTADFRDSQNKVHERLRTVFFGNWRTT
jgi:hypothetical protein